MPQPDQTNDYTIRDLDHRILCARRGQDSSPTPARWLQWQHLIDALHLQKRAILGDFRD